MKIYWAGRGYSLSQPRLDKMPAILYITYISWLYFVVVLLFKSPKVLKCVRLGAIKNISHFFQIMANRGRAIIWTKDSLIYWCTYASLWLNELTHLGAVPCMCVWSTCSTKFRSKFTHFLSWKYTCKCIRYNAAMFRPRSVSMLKHIL